MADNREQDRAARIRQSRQVIAGSDLPQSGGFTPVETGPTASPAFWYLVGVAALVVLSAVLWAVAGMGWATPVLLLLALALLAGWFVL